MACLVTVLYILYCMQITVVKGGKILLHNTSCNNLPDHNYSHAPIITNPQNYINNNTLHQSILEAHENNQNEVTPNHMISNDTERHRVKRSGGYSSLIAVVGSNNISNERKQQQPSALSKDDDESLEQLLVTMVTKEMRDCSLVVSNDAGFDDSLALQAIIKLPNPKQVIRVKSPEDLNSIIWEAANCRSYLFLLQAPDTLLKFVREGEEPWDFGGRYVAVGFSREELEALALSKRGSKTEQIVGMIKGNRKGEWGIYTNSLYWGRKIRRLNTWRGFFTSPSTLFPDKMANLQGATLRVVTFEWEPSVLYFRDTDGKMKYPFGIDIEVVSALSSVLNFTLEFVEPPPGELWGIETGNGSWNGMVGKLSKNEGDIGVANLFLTLGRLGVVDYSAPYDAEVSCFLARGNPPAPRWKALALPFQGITWLAILGGLISSGFVLYLLAIASERCGGERQMFQTILSACQYSFAVHCQENQVTLPDRLNTQIFICVLWLYTFIITAAYGSNLTAYLTVVQTPSSMETVRELFNSRLEVSGLGGFFKGALASSVDPYLQGLANRFEAYDDLNIVWPKVMNGRAVYLHNRQFLEFIITTQFTHKGTSSMRIMKECFSPYNIGMALQRNSPVKRKFDKVIRWMLESGLVRRWFLESLRQSIKLKESKSGNKEGSAGRDNLPGAQDSKSSDNGVIPLSIDHLQGIFFILAFGNVLGIFVFLVESCVVKAQQHVHRRKEQRREQH